MIRTLRRRFVFTAMLSLCILVLILIAGITLLSYVMMERNADQTLELLSSAPDREPNFAGAERRPVFGYQLGPTGTESMGHFAVMLDAEGELIMVESNFSVSIGESEALAYAEAALAEGGTGGKVGSYKYLRTELAQGGCKLVFLDNAAQVRTLLNTLTASCLVGLACLLVMLPIVLLIARRSTRPIAETMEKQRRFVTDAGHEIKTPLAIILANAEAMELTQGETKWSRNIRGQTTRLSGLMQRLLTLSKLDENAGAQPMVPVDLSRLTAEAADAFTALAEQHGLRLEADIVPGVSLRGDEAGLEQLLSVLLDNAVKYAEDGSAVALRLRGGRHPALEVSNRCVRLPEAAPEVLFDRFYRADSARTQAGGGYGIGLSVARAVTEQHHGRLRAFYDDEHTIRFRAEF